MPNSSLDSSPHGIPKHYRLTHQEWVAISRRLKGAELRVLYYIRTLSPFSDEWVDVNVTTIAEDLGIRKGTVSKALRVLASDNFRLIDLKIKTASVRLLPCAPVLLEEDTPAPEPAPETERNVPKTNGSSSSKPVSVSSPDQGETDASVLLLHRISKAGLPINPTIQNAIAQLLNSHTPAAAARAVENALSAVQEQQQQGKVRNIGGLFIAALRGGYTANTAKRQARGQARGQSQEDLVSVGPSPSATGPPPGPPDWSAVELGIDQALMAGDRRFALTRLRQLWDVGWHDSIEQLCLLRRDWGFEMNESGVSDARAP
jgi:hypothetical protein